MREKMRVARFVGGVVWVLLLFISFDAWPAVKRYRFEQWSILIESRSGEITMLYGADTVVAHSIATWGVDNHRRAMSQATSHRTTICDHSDIYGQGKFISLKANYGDERIEQRIFLYSAKPYLHTELEVSSKDGVELNYMAPISCKRPYTLFSEHSPEGYYSLFVPFDNDAFVRYRSIAFGKPTESYGVTALFDRGTQRGVVLGAIEHTEWKTGIKATTSPSHNENRAGGVVRSLQLFGGASSSVTRDLLPHGRLSAESVKSPRMTIGWYEDWREGMELFGDQCATFAPKLPSLGARPFGWNSWGALAEKVTFQKAVEVSDFIHDNLQGKSFENEGTVYIDIDSFWDFGFKPEQHKIFVEHCHANGQKAGIYWCPFTDWGGNGKARVVRGMDYRWEDVYIRAKGEPVKFDGAYAIDPTHPAVRRRIELQIKQFIEWGYEYVKLDFMAHGAYQSDSYYDKKVTTAMQAYNQGMQYIVEQCQGKLWINLSIAPLFPGNYAHSRRISCDAWADIKNTEYVLNSLSYGWWLDHIYHYNDGDHVVYKEVSEGENRARITSSAITGVYFLGDDMSKGGSKDVKQRVIRNTTNPGINEIARTCPSFRPVRIAQGDRGSDMFYHNTGKWLYVAIFNFEAKPTTKEVALSKLGLSAERQYKAVELWSGEELQLSGNLSSTIGAKDVKVYRIEL